MQQRTRRILAGTIAAAAVTTSMTACRGGASADDSSGTPKVSIMVGGIDKVIYLPAKLTEQLGYFKDAGVDVDLKT